MIELPSDDANKGLIKPQVKNPPAEAALNLDDLVSKQTTQVKVVIVNPNSSVYVFTKFDEKTKSMILNSVYRENWKTVANLVV